MSLRDVQDSDEGGSCLHGLQSFLEAVEAGDAAENETVRFRQFVRGCQSFEERCSIPVDIFFVPLNRGFRS